MATQLWEAQQQARTALVPAEFQAAATGGVHGEHDVVIHRPVAPGEPLETWVQGFGTRARGRNSQVVLHYATIDAERKPVVEQWWTTVWLGVVCDESGGARPGHPFPEPARDRPMGTWQVEIDADMARRYAQVSGDWSPHHFDVEAARRSGVDRVFLHGLCTMALCAQGVVALAAGGDPDLVKRIAVRFARPASLGEELNVHLYDAGGSVCAFEGTVNDETVIAHGRAELR